MNPEVHSTECDDMTNQFNMTAKYFSTVAVVVLVGCASKPAERQQSPTPTPKALAEFMARACPGPLIQTSQNTFVLSPVGGRESCAADSKYVSPVYEQAKTWCGSIGGVLQSDPRPWMQTHYCKKFDATIAGYRHNGRDYEVTDGQALRSEAEATLARRKKEQVAHQVYVAGPGMHGTLTTTLGETFQIARVGSVGFAVNYTFGVEGHRDAKALSDVKEMTYERGRVSWRTEDGEVIEGRINGNRLFLAYVEESPSGGLRTVVGGIQRDVVSRRFVVTIRNADGSLRYGTFRPEEVAAMKLTQRTEPLTGQLRDVPAEAYQRALRLIASSKPSNLPEFATYYLETSRPRYKAPSECNDRFQNETLLAYCKLWHQASDRAQAQQSWLKKDLEVHFAGAPDTAL